MTKESKKKLLQSTAASYYCLPSREESYEKVREIFTHPALQMVTVTITEKGYGLKTSAGTFLPVIQKDIEAGPHCSYHTMSILASFLWSRFQGMLTDSRSFLSYPKHEYFRRILCQVISEWVEDGQLPEDLNFLGTIVANISYQNAKNYFQF